MADRTTLSLNPRERDQLQQLAAQLGILATRGAGTGMLGSISGLMASINEAYTDDPARALTLLARMLQRKRPDVFGYWLVGDQRLVVRWTAQPPKSKRGEAALTVMPFSPDNYPPRSPNGHDHYIVPDVVTDEDIRWLQQSDVTVQREDVHGLALVQ